MVTQLIRGTGTSYTVSTVILTDGWEHHRCTNSFCRPATSSVIYINTHEDVQRECLWLLQDSINKTPSTSCIQLWNYRQNLLVWRQRKHTGGCWLKTVTVRKPPKLKSGISLWRGAGGIMWLFTAAADRQMNTARRPQRGNAPRSLAAIFTHRLPGGTEALAKIKSKSCRSSTRRPCL